MVEQTSNLVEQTSNWANILKAVGNPLIFFALVVLAISTTTNVIIMRGGMAPEQVFWLAMFGGAPFLLSSQLLRSLRYAPDGFVGATNGPPGSDDLHSASGS